ncbi:MAG: pancreas/duodenum homeobox protein 1 [Desulfobacterales bacterium]|nr:pancreas/duodenum homeobox protein 1 [Desulfobacterales bacterium]
MTIENYDDLFTDDVLKKLFPGNRADKYFDALFGDSTEGAFDISLGYDGHDQNRLQFELRLRQRPRKCLACNLTYGLPRVFSRHPVINVKGLIEDIDKILGRQVKCTDWRLGRTQEISNELHIIPLFVSLEKT